ncbi:MAG: ATP-binding protein [Actinomycetaceae bacterium]|nr:ATP-binding protein [Actinomycetaceae bacterium]
MTSADAPTAWQADALTKVLDALPEASVILRPDNTFEYWSQTARLIPFFQGGKIRDSRLAEQILHARDTGRIIERDYELTHPSAVVPWSLRVRVSPISTHHTLVLVEDRTRVLQADATRREFVVNASHELKTPVGAISLLAETIHDNADDMRAVEEFSTQLVKESRRLTKLVHEIISLARLQDGKLPARSRPILVADAINDALDRVRHAAKDRTIDLKFAPAQGGEISVHADLELLTSALQNLLENAIRYSDPGGKVRVELGIGDNVEIKISDEGIGISEEDQERIFERFYRVDPARSRSTGGTGLGLSIVKHVMGYINGSIEVDSKLGEGTTFTVKLPRIDTSSPQTISWKTSLEGSK